MPNIQARDLGRGTPFRGALALGRVSPAGCHGAPRIRRGMLGRGAATLECWRHPFGCAGQQPCPFEQKRRMTPAADTTAREPQRGPPLHQQPQVSAPWRARRWGQHRSTSKRARQPQPQRPAWHTSTSSNTSVSGRAHPTRGYPRHLEPTLRSPTVGLSWASISDYKRPGFAIAQRVGYLAVSFAGRAPVIAFIGQSGSRELSSQFRAVGMVGQSCKPCPELGRMRLGPMLVRSRLGIVLAPLGLRHAGALARPSGAQFGRLSSAA